MNAKLYNILNKNLSELIIEYEKKTEYFKIIFKNVLILQNQQILNNTSDIFYLRGLNGTIINNKFYDFNIIKLKFTNDFLFIDNEKITLLNFNFTECHLPNELEDFYKNKSIRELIDYRENINKIITWKRDNCKHENGTFICLYGDIRNNSERILCNNCLQPLGYPLLGKELLGIINFNLNNINEEQIECIEILKQKNFSKIFGFSFVNQQNSDTFYISDNYENALQKYYKLNIKNPKEVLNYFLNLLDEPNKQYLDLLNKKIINKIPIEL